MNAIYDNIKAAGILPVVVIDDASKAVQLAEALRNGGINCAEITLRTDAAIEAIANIAKAFPDMLLGAGTVLTKDDVDRAVGAGARFVVSPGSNPETIKHCIANNVPIVPGVATPSEIEQALSLGLNVLKLFPAEVVGGVKMLKALSSPYSMVKFIPTGGISASNLSEYVQCKNVLACGGSYMVTKDMINNNEFDKITALSKETMEVISNIRGGIQ